MALSLMYIRGSLKAIIWGFLAVFLLSMSIGGLVGGANLIDEIFGSNLSGNAAGSVNKDMITIEELSQAIAQQSEATRQQFGELSDRLIDQAESQAWENLVAARLVAAEIDDREIMATGEEIFYVLETYPPAVLRQEEAFMTDGLFDPQAYYSALRNPQGNEWAPVEQYLRQLLPGDKLSQRVQAATFVTAEVRYCFDLSCFYFHHNHTPIVGIVFFQCAEQCIFCNVLQVDVNSSFKVKPIYGAYFIPVIYRLPISSSYLLIECSAILTR